MAETRKVMAIYGTRPEAIKMAPLIAAMRADDTLSPIVAVTGQHREMLDQVNTLFGIVPDHDLDLMVPGATLSEMSSRTLVATGTLLHAVRPDAVVVQGDTTSAFVSALSAFYQGCPVVHLEAGLRTGDMAAPFPEEANRRLTAPIASLHLAPTAASRANLLSEGIAQELIAVTGNTVIDALHEAISFPLESNGGAVREIINSGRRYVLVTTHRRESWGGPMRQAMKGLRRVAEQETDLLFLVPMHRNPIVRDVIQDVLGETSNAILTEPLSYHEFCHAMQRAFVLVTDSGGVQEEGPSLGKPVLVLRETTERPEAVDAGTVKLIGTDVDVVQRELTELVRNRLVYECMANAVNPYGDGLAAIRANAAIRHMFGFGERLADFEPITVKRGINV